MCFFQILQGYAALAVGSLLTALSSVLAIVIGPVYHLLFHWWLKYWIRNPFEVVPMIWAELMNYVVYHGIAGIREVTEGAIAQIHDGDVVVWIVGPHPSDLATAPTVYSITRVTPRFRVIAKRRLNLLLRLAVKAMQDIAIFIDRENQEIWSGQIKAGIATLGSDTQSILIMPDMHRFKPWRLREDLEEFREKIPDLADWLKYTLVPRAGGLFTVLQALKGRRVRIIDITSTFDVEEYSALYVPRICNAVFHIRLREVTHRVPEDLENLEIFLNELYRQKNFEIARIIATQPGRPHFKGNSVCACTQPPCAHH